VSKNPDPREIRTPLGWEFHPAETRAAVLKAVAAGLKVHPEWATEQSGLGFSRLFLAAYRGQAEIVALLLDLGAPTHHSMFQQTVRPEVVEDASVLHAALGMVIPPQDEAGRVDAATVELLLARGLNPNEVLEVGSDVSFPLHAAARNDARIVGLLLARGADVHLLDGRGRTPLHHAHDVETARILTAAGARLDARDHDGSSPLHAAALSLEPAAELVDWLVEQGQPMDPWSAASLDLADRLVALLKLDPAAANRHGAHGMTPLHWAALNGCAGATRALLEHGAEADSRDEGGRTPLPIAARENYTAVAALLLAAKASPDQMYLDGTTPLLHFAVQKGRFHLVVQLIAAGANADRADRDGERALHLAADGPRADLVKELICAGASVDARRRNGDTPLLIAVRGPRSPQSLAAIRILLEAGADPEARDSRERSPLELAADQPEFAALLRKYGAKN